MASKMNRALSSVRCNTEQQPMLIKNCYTLGSESTHASLLPFSGHEYNISKAIQDGSLVFEVQIGSAILFS
jgi:hypothetical protein